MKLDGLSQQTISRIQKAQQIALEHDLEAELTDLSVIYSPKFSEMLWKPLAGLTEAYEVQDMHLKRVFYRTDRTIFAFQIDESGPMPEEVHNALGIETGEDFVSLDGIPLKRVQVGNITYYGR